MRRLVTLIVTFGLILAASGFAYAWWCPADGFTYPGGPAYMYGATAFQNDPQGQALAAKEAELTDLLNQGGSGMDQGRITALNREVIQLRSQLARRYVAAGSYGDNWGWGGYGNCW